MGATLRNSASVFYCTDLSLTKINAVVTCEVNFFSAFVDVRLK